MFLKNKLIVIIIAVLLSLVIGMVVYYFVQKSDSKSSNTNNQSSANDEVTTSSNETVLNNDSANIKFQNLSTQNIDGASLWLFAVPDDQSQVVLSTESNGSIKMAKFDISNSTQKLDWKTVISNNDIGGKGVA
ncbi:MAG: hypothetical protein ACD_58C00094G0001, partial [uncultured bacterium]